MHERENFDSESGIRKKESEGAQEELTWKGTVSNRLSE
jgi:hypothetical protein